MSDAISKIGEGLEQSFLMAYEAWWAPGTGTATSRFGLQAATFAARWSRRWA